MIRYDAITDFSSRWSRGRFVLSFFVTHHVGVKRERWRMYNFFLLTIAPWRKLSTAFSLPSSLELQRPFSALLYHTRLKLISVSLFLFQFNRSTLHWTIQTLQKIKISLLLASVVSAWDEPGKPPGEYRLSLHIYSFFIVSHHQSLSLPSFNSPVSGL